MKMSRRLPRGRLILTACAVVAGFATSVAASGRPIIQDTRPLSQYWGFASSPAEQAVEEAIFDLEEFGRQELIRGCMAANGFDYNSLAGIHRDQGRYSSKRSGSDFRKSESGSV